MPHMKYNKKLPVDPSILTPYEEQIYELYKQGMGPKDISNALGGRSGPKTIAVRLVTIREKIALKEIMDAQDRRISWS